MADLKLSFAIAPYDRVMPLITGEVKPLGITLEYWGAQGMGNPFYDQIKFQRWDVSEMSMSSFLRMRPTGWGYRMLPIFHNRNFSWTNIHIRNGSGIRQGHPEDLKGKRVGIADYQMSLGLWTRGILQMEFGVKPEDMVWYQERSEHFSHTGASGSAGLGVPKNVELHYATTDFNTMFLKGELDATTGLSMLIGRGGGGPSQSTPLAGIGRVQADLSAKPDMVSLLFPDPRQESIRFYKKTGVYPPNHCTVVRESILDEYPWAAVSLMEAFEESKRLSLERLHQSPPTLMVFGQQYFKELAEIFGPDPFPYGIKANAKALEMAQTFSLQQGLTERKQPLDEIFPEEIIFREERA
jgi:4,5-dihydroxyphthalate decarboxylase